jgi:hypothetical protein
LNDIDHRRPVPFILFFCVFLINTGILQVKVGCHIARRYIFFFLSLLFQTFSIFNFQSPLKLYLLSSILSSFISYDAPLYTFLFFSLLSGTSDIPVVEELLVMKLTEIRHRTYQTKVDKANLMKDKEMEKEREKEKERNALEKKNTQANSATNTSTNTPKSRRKTHRKRSGSDAPDAGAGNSKYALTPIATGRSASPSDSPSPSPSPSVTASSSSLLADDPADTDADPDTDPRDDPSDPDYEPTDEEIQEFRDYRQHQV